MKYIQTQKKVWNILQLLMGWIFIWAFFDKLLGLGFATSSEAAWIAGGSPTTGFLTHAVTGPFASIFHAMAGSTMVDVLFMGGLLFTGFTLFTGVMVRLGSYTGMTMLLLMYIAASLPPVNNPVVDEHIVYIVVLCGIATRKHAILLGVWWRKIPIVQKYPFLQ